MVSEPAERMGQNVQKPLLNGGYLLQCLDSTVWGWDISLEETLVHSSLAHPKYHPYGALRA